jgi:predicted nucleotidyltransferase
MGRTAAELTAQEKNRYREYARLEEEAERRREAARRESALGIARAAAVILKQTFGATGVFLFGSLADGGPFHARSDIDLGVEGLQPGDYWRADCRLEALGGDLEIDLVALDTAPPALAQIIRRDGWQL